MADLSLSNFKGQFQSGARPTLYSVTIAELGGSLEFLCKGTSLPASTIGQIEVPYKGRQLKIGGNRTYADWTVTILNDVDFAARKAAESWMDIINGPASNVGAVSIAQYMRDAKVEQLGQDGAVLYTYEFKDIWPTEIGEIELAYDSNDTIEEYTITFAIGSYFHSDGAVL
jgi:hypothetical protein